MKQLGWIMMVGLLGACADDWSAGPGQDVAADAGSMQQIAPDASGAAARPRAPRAFAGAPDRGSLVDYPADAVVRRSGAYTYHAAQLSEEHALRATITGRLNFTAPDGTAIPLDYVRHVEHPDGNWSWIGRAPGEQGESTVLTFGEAAVFGSIPQGGDKPPLRLTVSDGRSWVVSADPRLLRRIHNEATHPTRPDYLVPPKMVPPKTAAAAGTAVGMQAMAAAPLAAAAIAGKTVVDVAVGYTGGFAAARGGDAAAVTRIHNLVDITNQAYINSRVNAEVRLVHAMPVSYADATDNGIALEELTGFKAPSTRTTPVPAFSALRAARETYGADLVVLVRKFQAPENEGCGIAWLIGGDRSGIANSDSFFGYSVVSDGQDRGTDGNTYFCREETFAHEVGHSMGSQHDSGNAKDGDGALNYGAYDYSFGYKNSVSGNFYTVMAYGDSGQKSYRVFSNPDVTYCGGVACGIPNQADNARSLNQTVATIAGFRATVTPQVSRYTPHDFDGDGKSDLLWRNSRSGSNALWLAAIAADSQTVTTVSNLDWRIAGMGDFNGDAKADILWRNAGSGGNVIWLSANQATSQAVSPVAGNAWRIVGVGDFDGDGRSDILWRNHVSGANTIWRSGNFGTSMAVAAVTTQDWQVVGVGDFDGDGRSDILWRNSVSGANAIWRSGNFGTSTAVAAIANRSWQVKGVADFDGDGRSDILWRNASSGGNVVWRSGSSASPQAVATVSNLEWQVAAAGDYDADGRADIVWRNVRTGGNEIWKGANQLNVQAVAPVSNLDWRIIP